METLLPAKSVIHQIGKDVNQTMFRMAVVIPHTPQKQKTSPIQPRYGSTFSKSSLAFGFLERINDGVAIRLNMITVIPQIIFFVFLGH